MTTTGVDPIPREARAFQGRRAGIVTRCIAAGIDGAVVLALIGVTFLTVWVVIIILPGDRLSPPTSPIWVSLLLLHTATTLYLTVLWTAGGRTVGCHVMGLRVVDRKGQTLHFIPALLRALFCVTFPFGIAWVAVSNANRSIQDLVMRTSVIHDWAVRPKVIPPPPD